VNFHCTGSRAKEPPWCDELAVVYVQHVDDGPNLYFLHVCIGYGRREVFSDCTEILFPDVVFGLSKCEMRASANPIERVD
jgi:hypothetical protein